MSCSSTDTLTGVSGALAHWRPYHSDLIPHPSLPWLGLKIFPFIWVFRNFTMIYLGTDLFLLILPNTLCPFQYETSVFLLFWEMLLYLWNILPLSVLFGRPISRTWWLTFAMLPLYIYHYAHLCKFRNEKETAPLYLLTCIPLFPAGWKSQPSFLFSIHSNFQSYYALEPLWGGPRRAFKKWVKSQL